MHTKLVCNVYMYDAAVFTEDNDINVYNGALVGECGINIYGWVVQRGNQFHFIAIKKPLTLFTWSQWGKRIRRVSRIKKLLTEKRAEDLKFCPTM